MLAKGTFIYICNRKLHQKIKRNLTSCLSLQKTRTVARSWKIQISRNSVELKWKKEGNCKLMWWLQEYPCSSKRIINWLRQWETKAVGSGNISVEGHTPAAFQSHVQTKTGYLPTLAFSHLSPGQSKYPLLWEQAGTWSPERWQYDFIPVRQPTSAALMILHL